MIFVDANVPMYMAGGQHPLKDRVEALIDQLRADGEEFVTDAEVYQEILHRHSSTNSLDMVDPTFDALDSLPCVRVFAIRLRHIRVARELLNSVPKISARDAIHVAVMQSEGITRMLSFDGDMDACPGIERVS